MLADDDEKIKPTADTVIVLWMAGGMAHTETFDPKRYTPYEKGLASNAVLSTFPAIDSAVDNIKLSQGLENIARVMDRATLDPLLHGGRPGLHPALAPSISMAHGLRAAADRGRAAHRRRHRPHARAVESRDTGVHRHRPAFRPGRRRGAQGVSHGRVSRQRVRAVPHRQPGAGGRERPPARGHEPGPLRKPRSLLPQTGRGKVPWENTAAISSSNRSSARWTTRIAC